MLQDPLDDNVVPIVQELQRRLPLVNLISEGQGEDEDNLGAENDLETSEENGITSPMSLLSCLFTSSTSFMFIFETLTMQLYWIHQLFRL